MLLGSKPQRLSKLEWPNNVRSCKIFLIRCSEIHSFVFGVNRKLFSLLCLAFLSLPLGEAEEARHLSWEGEHRTQGWVWVWGLGLEPEKCEQGAPTEGLSHMMSIIK